MPVAPVLAAFATVAVLSRLRPAGVAARAAAGVAAGAAAGVAAGAVAEFLFLQLLESPWFVFLV